MSGSSTLISNEHNKKRRTRVESDQNPIDNFQLYYDKVGDLIFACNTKTHMFGLSLQFSDPNDLTWRETQSICDASRLFCPGNLLDPSHFATFLERMELKYGMTKGPITQNDGRICAACYPRVGTKQYGINENELMSTKMEIDMERKLVVIFSISARNIVYSIQMNTHGKYGRLTQTECKALADFLTVLEPGDILSELQFQDAVKLLENQYGKAIKKVNENNSLFIFELSPEEYFIENLMNFNTPENAQLMEPTTPPRPKVKIVGQSNSPGIFSIASVPMTPRGSALLSFCPYPGFSYVSLLANSGQAQVFEGIRLSDNLRVAIKVFNVRHMNKNPTNKNHIENFTCWKNELRLLLKASEHPNIVTVVDFFENPVPVLITKFIDGITLRDYVQQNGPFNQVNGINLAKRIVEGLLHLHNQGIVHRDMKPNNIIILKNNLGAIHPVIIDLGISSVLPYHGEITGKKNPHVNSAFTDCTKGTPLWMAPEMYLRQKWSIKTDIFSFGLILWEIFSGEKPYVNEYPHLTDQALLFEICKGLRPSLSRICNNNVEVRIGNLINQCWDNDCEKRPSSNQLLNSFDRESPRSVFERFDENGDGKLEYAEFITYVKECLPILYKPIEATNLFYIIDNDKSGTITFDEFERFSRYLDMYGLRRLSELVHNQPNYM